MVHIYISHQSVAPKWQHLRVACSICSQFWASSVNMWPIKHWTKIISLMCDQSNTGRREYNYVCAVRTNSRTVWATILTLLFTTLSFLFRSLYWPRGNNPPCYLALHIYSPSKTNPKVVRNNDNDNNHNHNKHFYAGQLNSFTHLRAFLLRTPWPRHFGPPN
jgi:hypothetical protein